MAMKGQQHASASHQSAYERFDAAWRRLAASKIDCAHITASGGRNIFLTPARMTYGAPRTVCANHASADRMEALLETHIRTPLRCHCNQSDAGAAIGTDYSKTECAHGMEVIDTAAVFDGPLAPGSAGDGMHLEGISNAALIQMLVHRLVGFDARDWWGDQAGWREAVRRACVK